MSSMLALTSSLRLFLAFYRGLLIMLSFTNLSKHTATGALPLKPSKGTVK